MRDTHARAMSHAPLLTSWRTRVRFAQMRSQEVRGMSCRASCTRRRSTSSHEEPPPQPSCSARVRRTAAACGSICSWEHSLCPVRDPPVCHWLGVVLVSAGLPPGPGAATASRPGCPGKDVQPVRHRECAAVVREHLEQRVVAPRSVLCGWRQRPPRAALSGVGAPRARCPHPAGLGRECV